LPQPGVHVKATQGQARAAPIYASSPAMNPAAASPSS